MMSFRHALFLEKSCLLWTKGLCIPTLAAHSEPCSSDGELHVTGAVSSPPRGGYVCHSQVVAEVCCSRQHGSH